MVILTFTGLVKTLYPESQNQHSYLKLNIQLVYQEIKRSIFHFYYLTTPYFAIK